MIQGFRNCGINGHGACLPAARGKADAALMRTLALDGGDRMAAEYVKKLYSSRLP